MGVVKLINSPDPEFHIPGRKPIFEVKIGNLVQWESMGTFLFQTPRKVERIEEGADGKYIFVEGTKTGIPIEQVIVME